MSTADSTRAPAFTTDRERRITSWNAAAERLLGHRADEVLGRSCHDVLRGCDLFGHPACTDGCTLHGASESSAGPRPHILRVTDARGRMLDLRVSVHLAHEPAGPVRFVHVLEPFVPRVVHITHRPYPLDTTDPTVADG